MSAKPTTASQPASQPAKKNGTKMKTALYDQFTVPIDNIDLNQISNQADKFYFNSIQNIPDKIFQAISNFRLYHGAESLDLLLKMFEENKTIADIAETFDVTRQQVYNWRKNFTLQVWKRNELIVEYQKIMEETYHQYNRQTLKFNQKYKEKE